MTAHLLCNRDMESADVRSFAGGEVAVYSARCPGKEGPNEDAAALIEIDGKRRHAISYLGDFLFGPDRVRTPVRALSGGEQNRAILARLFSKPANLLVLDEPTNDLDIETLELLEEILLQFEGTVLLVSHDREFMDNVVTSLLVLRGDGTVEEQAGGYSDWEARGGRLEELSEQSGAKNQPPVRETRPQPVTPGKRKKLSYKEQRELDGLPQEIAGLETEIAALEATLADASLYERDRAAFDTAAARLEERRGRLAEAESRWLELEERREALATGAERGGWSAGLLQAWCQG